MFGVPRLLQYQHPEPTDNRVAATGADWAMAVIVCIAYGVAAFACAEDGEDEAALRLLGAAGLLREETRASATLDDPSLRERCLADLASRLGRAEAERLLAEGADAELESLFPVT